MRQASELPINDNFIADYKGWTITIDLSGLFTVSNGKRWWQWPGGPDLDKNVRFIEAVIDAK